MAMTSRPETDREASRAQQGRERRDERLVHDEEGGLWRIREVSFADTRPSLIFESEISFRRVRTYPPHWRTLSDEELYALSWGT